MQAIPVDVIGPSVGLALGAGAALVVALTVLVIVVEAVALRLVGWAPFWRSLLASLVMNAASALTGTLVIGLVLIAGSVTWVIGAFFASVLVEGAILSLMNRGQPGRNWRAALIVNLATYLPLGLIYIVATAIGQ